MKIYLKNILKVFLTFKILSLPAYANAGLPMIVIAWPLFAIAFIPIVFIEWLTLKKWLKGCSSKKLYWTSFYANLVSTMGGIPLAWILMMLAQISIPGGTGSYPLFIPFWRYFLGVTVQSAWLLPYESQLYWMIPTALIILLIPFFFISYEIEVKISLWLLRKESVKQDDIKKSVWKANINSYRILFILIFLILIFNVLSNKI